MKKEKTAIISTVHGPIRVPLAYENAGLGVTRAHTVNGISTTHWRISHLASGYGIGVADGFCFTSIEKARAVVDRLAPLADWTQRTAQEVSDSASKPGLSSRVLKTFQFAESEGLCEQIQPVEVDE